MKASVKFRDDQRPLFRAKIPLNILGLPFQSGIVAGESKELTLNLGTFFESGPSVRIAYSPNDTWNPFSLVVKTGTGAFGSPFSSSMLMSAEFNLLGRGNPRFMLHFKPRFGDFSAKKSHSSVFDSLVMKPPNGVVENGDDDASSIHGVETPITMKKFTALPSVTPSAGSIAGLFSGMEVSANTEVPVRGRAVVNFRWGVRVPSENPTAGISFQKIPFLVMNKIGIEHVEGQDSATKAVGKAQPEDADVAEACFAVQRQLEAIHSENGLLKKAVEDLRRDIGVGVWWSSSSSPARSFESGGKIDRRSNEKKASAPDFNGYPAKSAEADVSEELKKALKGA
ncbi:hypothetical protein PanWU01x14_210560 [Parasponia andersonii]|uniref:Uncharacterized protein n=1 Tax=Parasponia andersonii TaxID=3476 RepID=A0A2P5BTZ9_PARAD|nr:hypothetical protein PanWU01x14_210560 [Parasponia andersonii]